MGLSEIFFPKRMWRTRPELKRRYEVVIVGGGSHGLATAYYLAKRHGIRDVAILEKSYIGSGASGRNTTIIRSNYRTPEGAAFYGESVRLYEGPVGRARLQPHVLAARAPDARALGPRDDHDAGARRGQQAARDRLERDLPAAHRRALPRARPLAAPRVPDRRRALPPARRDHPPRRRRVGIRPRRGPARRGDPPGHRGHRLRAQRRSHHGRRDEPWAGRVRSGRERDRGLVVARRPARRAAAADHDAHPAGVRHRAGEAVPRRRPRLVAAPRVRLADRPRRVPHRRRDRAVHDVQERRARCRSSSTRRRTRSSSSHSSSARRSCARGRASATSRRTTARSSARRRSTTSTCRRGGGRTGSRPRRSSA